MTPHVTPYPVPVKTVVNAGPVHSAGLVADITTMITPMPGMRGTIIGWFRRFVVNTVVTTILIDGTADVKMLPINTSGVMQPSSFEELDLQAGGDRSWQYWTLHCSPNLKVNTNDQIIIGGTWYRVMGKKDYTLNGYIEYRLVETPKVEGAKPDGT